MTTAARARTSAAIAAGLLAAWGTAQAAWSFTHPVELALPEHLAEHRASEANYDDVAIGEDHDDVAVGDDDGALGADDEGAREGEEARGSDVEPAGVEAPGDAIVIGGEPLDPDSRVIGDVLAAHRARSAARDRALDLAPEPVETEAEAELAVLDTDLPHAEVVPPSLPLSDWALWMCGLLLLVATSVALAWFGLAERSGPSLPALGAAACFAAVLIGTALSMSLWMSSGSFVDWIAELSYPLLAAGAVLGTWAASWPRRAPIALAAVAIAIELFAPGIWGDEWLFPSTLCGQVPLFVLAFALRPAPEQATDALPAAAAPAEALPRARYESALLHLALTTVAVLVFGSIVIAVAAAATISRHAYVSSAHGVFWGWLFVLQVCCAGVLTVIARARRASKAAPRWAVAAASLWVGAFVVRVFVAMGEIRDDVASPASLQVVLAVVLIHGASFVLLERALRGEVGVRGSVAQNVALSLAVLPIGWVLGAWYVAPLGMLPTLALCACAGVAVGWWASIERVRIAAHAVHLEKQARLDEYYAGR